jgi:hypothetical protein
MRTTLCMMRRSGRYAGPTTYVLAIRLTTTCTREQVVPEGNIQNDCSMSAGETPIMVLFPN